MQPLLILHVGAAASLLAVTLTVPACKTCTFQALDFVRFVKTVEQNMQCSFIYLKVSPPLAVFKSLLMSVFDVDLVC